MATIFICPSPPNQSSPVAINLCPDSPRISFSYNLDHNPSPSSDHVPRSDQNLSDFDFDFCLPCELGIEPSPADELFFNGVILPTHIKQPNPNPNPPTLPLEPSTKETEEADEDEEEEEVTSLTKASLIREEKGNSNSKSFWRFMRSSSLNSDNTTHCKKGSIWSSLPLLARSYSTGLRNSSSSSSSSSSLRNSKPPLKKVQFGKAGNSTSPVLNVPPLYITKGTSDLLGFGSLFRNGNDKKGKKT